MREQNTLISWRARSWTITARLASLKDRFLLMTASVNIQRRASSFIVHSLPIWEPRKKKLIAENVGCRINKHNAQTHVFVAKDLGTGMQLDVKIV